MIDNLWSSHVVITECNAVRAICQPLKLIAIDGFFFIRLLPNDQFINLATDPVWTEHFLTRYYAGSYDFSTVKQHLALDHNVDIWSLSKKNQFFVDAAQYFNIKEGLSITYAHKSWKDIFCFYIKNQNSMTLAKLINKIDLMRKFSEYFIECAEPILKVGNNQPLWIPKFYTAAFSQKTTSVKNQTFLERLSVAQGIFYEGFASLTPQEINCIRLARLGLNAQAIASQLSLSKRTVESYLLNARNRTNCKNIIELVAQYQEIKNIL